MVWVFICFSLDFSLLLKSAMASKVKTAPVHPSYFEMVKEAIAATSKPVKGSSRPSIVKYLEAKYGKVLGRNFKPALRLALKKAVSKGALAQVKGSFRLAKQAKVKKVKKPKKPKAKKVKKPKAKKVKKPKAKKPKKSKAAKKTAKPAKKASKVKAKKSTKPKVPKVKKASQEVAASAEAPKAE